MNKEKNKYHEVGPDNKELDDFLKRMIFPISNGELKEFAEIERLSNDTLTALNSLDDAVYADANEVKNLIKTERTPTD